MLKQRLVGGGGNAVATERRNPCHVNTVLVVYIAVTSSPALFHYATRFVETYREHQNFEKHHLVICCNGGPLSPKIQEIFEGLQCRFYIRMNDDGWDISAYQAIVREYESDFMVCFGESVRFHKPHWLDRLVESAREYGEGMYGCLSSHAIRPHLNTTAFAVSPRFLKQYPPVTNKAERYDFEHGVNSFWKRVVMAGGEARLVTWDGCWGPGDWRKPANILWRGDQSNCLVYANHTDNWIGKHESVRQAWSARADAPFK